MTDSSGGAFTLVLVIAEEQEQYGKRGGRWETEFYPTPIGVTFMVVYLE